MNTQETENFLREIVGTLVGVSADDIDPQQPLYLLGLDSLQGIELKQRLEAFSGKELPISDYLEGPPIRRLAELVCGHAEGRDTAAGGGLPTLPGDPISGVLAEFRKDPFELLSRARREHGRTVLFRLGPYPVYLFCHPEDVGHILVHNRDLFKAENFDRIRAVLGNGLITAEGESWARQRRLARPTFTNRNIAAFSDQISVIVADMIDQWRDREGYWDLGEEMRRMTLAIIGKLLFSRTWNGRDADDFLQALAVLGNYTSDNLDFLPGEAVSGEHEQQLAVVNRVVGDLIRERRRGATEADLLQSLMDTIEAGERLSDVEIRDMLLTLMAAGHHTTAGTLTFLFYELCGHPQLARELADGGDDAYLDQCIQEAMRLYPSGWFLTRRATCDTHIGEVPVPKGALLAVCPYLTHRDPEYWPDPEVFEPARHGKRPPHKYAYIPFGAGPRRCIGAGLSMLEMRLLVKEALSRFEMELDPQSLPLRLASKNTLTTRDPIRVRVRPRGDTR